MANYKENYKKHDKDTYLRDWWGDVENEISNIYGIADNHINGDADKHKAKDIIFEDASGGESDVQSALEDNIIALANLEFDVGQHKEQISSLETNSAGKKVERETFAVDPESEEIMAQKGAEIFNNYEGGSYDGDLTEDDENYPKEFALLGTPYSQNIATGLYSSAFGGATLALGDFAFSTGYDNTAKGRASATFGRYHKACARYSFASGSGNKTYSNTSLAFGRDNVTGSENALIPGYVDSYSVEGALAGGVESKATGSYSVALGKKCVSSGVASLAIGVNAVADNKDGSFAIGNGVTASGTYSFASGLGTKSEGRAAIAMGENSQASGAAAVALGLGSTASKKCAMAFGFKVQANNDGAVALGGIADDGVTVTTASGKNSLAVGSGASTEGKDSLSVGYKGTIAKGAGSFALGTGAVASGTRSVAIGESTKTGESHSHAMAVGLSVQTTAPNQFVSGAYNKLGNANLIFMVGNGVDGANRSNAYTLDKDGNGWYAGGITVGADKDKVITERQTGDLSALLTEDKTTLVAIIQDLISRVEALESVGSTLDETIALQESYIEGGAE